MGEDQKNQTSKDTVEEYVENLDWRVKENSTVTYSLGGLILHNSSTVTANHWLTKIYDKEIADAHSNADIHIHDLGMLSAYCAGWSLKQLIKDGLGGVPGKITSSPASHLSTLCNQMVNFLGIMQNEWAGAQAFSSFDTYLAPFVKVDNLSYREVKQCIQSFVYGVNTPSRWGTQAPFTNITLDWVVPNDLAYLPCIVGGKEMDFCYKDCKKEMDMINKAFIEVMIEGDANGRGFQYPIPTYSITRDFDWSETENNKLLFEMTAKYGTPYFSNYINRDMEPSDVRSMCPLAPDTEVFVKGKSGAVSLEKIEGVYRDFERSGEDCLVFTPNGWKKGHPVKTDKTKTIRVSLSNGASVVFGVNHLQPVRDHGTLHADQLMVGMELPFLKRALNKSKDESNDFGFVIGAYIGCGNVDKNGITYTLHAEGRDDKTHETIVKFWKKFGIKSSISYCGAKRTITLDPKAGEYIGRAIDLKNKEIKPMVFGLCSSFRAGIIDGLQTISGKKGVRKLYLASTKAVDDICKILVSLGRKYVVSEISNSEKRFIKGKYRVEYPSKARNSENNVRIYDEDNDYYYYTITGVEDVCCDSESLYCFEIDSDDHLFSLANGLVTHNCRLRLDLRELRKKSGGYFGSGESTGSIGVVTINMPRIAYLSKDKDEFYRRLDHLMDISARSLDIKRKVVSKFLELGLYPYTKRYLGTFSNHFSTIGLVGMNEACLNAKWLGVDMTNPEAVAFTKDVLNHMRERLSDYQEQYGDLYNLEATPAESTSYRLAKHDKACYPDMIFATMDGVPYYTNSSHLPVGYTSDIFEALDIQDGLQTLYTSGTVFHAFLGQKLPDWRAAATLVRKIAEHYRLPYYTLSPTYSVCTEHGYITGEHFTCPTCGKKAEVYSRITGYYRPVQNWNDGKSQEYKDRKEYIIKNDFLGYDSSIVNNMSDEEYTKETTSTEYLLFATRTCPNCAMAKSILNGAGIEYTAIYVEDNKESAILYGIKKAPTLVIKDSSRITKVENASEIRKFISSL